VALRGMNLNTEEEICIDRALNAMMMVEEERKREKSCDEIPVEVELEVYFIPAGAEGSLVQHLQDDSSSVVMRTSEASRAHETFRLTRTPHCPLLV